MKTDRFEAIAQKLREINVLITKLPTQLFFQKLSKCFLLFQKCSKCLKVVHVARAYHSVSK